MQNSIMGMKQIRPTTWEDASNDIKIYNTFENSTALFLTSSITLRIRT